MAVFATPRTLLAARSVPCPLRLCHHAVGVSVVRHIPAAATSVQSGGNITEDIVQAYTNPSSEDFRTFRNKLLCISLQCSMK